MWRAMVVEPNRQPRARLVLQQTGELPSSRVALNLVRSGRRELQEAVIGEGLVAYLEAEASDEARNELSVARRPVQDFRDRDDVRGFNRYFPDDELLSRAIDSVSHLPSVVIIPLNGDETRIDLTYDLNSLPHPLDSQRFIGAHTLDWRAYLGNGTVILDGRTGPRNNYWNKPLNQLKFVLTGLRGLAGYLVGFVLRQTGRPIDVSLSRDPTFPRRQSQAESASPELARQVPDLASISGISAASVSIFIHGTHSHGLEGLKDLAPFQQGQPSLFRYEHDTFLHVASNGEELAEIIDRKIQTSFLTLIAHSRGGLVARLARLRLIRMKFPGRIRILTFGTPHLGTPLINRAQQNISLLFRLGRLGILGLPSLTPLDYVLSCLPRVRIIPSGISFMEEGNDGLQILNGLDEPNGIDCWGAKFDAASPQGGYGISLDGLLTGILFGADNDLIVPTASALGFGTPQPVLNCGHSGYFRESQVRAVVQQACPGVLQ